MNKIINILLVFIIVLIVLVPSYLSVRNEHARALKTVMEKEILEAANKCRVEDKCLDNTVTLSFLQENGYLDKIYDPVTKELVPNTSYVNFDENKLVIE